MFKTNCTDCGGDLMVVAFTAHTYIPLCPDGFSTDDAKFFDTEDEAVECRDCNKRAPLSDMLVDD